MVVKEDGTKWACQSCLKGHRVSGCTHIDRELTLVPKKGRPVTQCQHCRLERKKRSAHVKCECGETDKPHHAKEKCIHLREAEERAKAGFHDDSPSEKDPAYLTAVADEQGCCCHHGGKCTCSFLRRDSDEDSAAAHGPAVKPRLEKGSSDGAITVFTNGHHKPVHRKNHAAHESGLPYKAPVSKASTDSNVSTKARRSVENLTLDGHPTSSASYLPMANMPFSTDGRKSKSEHPSPKPVPYGECTALGDSRLMSIDFNALAQTQTNSSINSYTTENYASPLDAMSGTTESSFDPWSAFPSADANVIPNNNPFGVWPTQNDNCSISQPALTAASSGTQSEIDEITPMDDVYGYPMPSIQEDANSDVVNFVSDTSAQPNRRSLPPGFFGNIDLGVDVTSADWHVSINELGALGERKGTPGVSESLPNVWQTSAMAPMVSVPQRALGGLPYTARPQSRSVGSTSAPNDEIIKQLFPDLELNNGYFGPTGSPQMGAESMMGGSSKSGVTSIPYEFGPMDEEDGFTGQAWSDGSLSMPNDTYTTSYDLDQDFSNSDFSGNWSQ